MDSLTRIIRARSALVTSQPFFGSLALRLDVVARPDVETMATDGRRLFYAPAFVESLTEPELIGVVAHEVMHCALRHFARRGRRDLTEWNVATDHAINLDLKAAGFVLPRDVLADPRFRGFSAEDVHAALYGARPEDPPAAPAAASPEAEDGEDDGDQTGAGDGADGEDDGADADGAAGEDGADGGGEDSGNGEDDGAGSGGDGSDGAGEDGDADGAGDGSEDADGDGSDASGSGADGDPSAAGAGSGSGAGEDTAAGDGRGRGAGAGEAAEDDGGEAEADGRRGPMAPDPGRCGGVIDPEADDEADPAALDQLAREWEVYTRQAINAATKSAGSLPGFLSRVVADLDAPRVTWRDVLRRFIDQSTSRDYSWTRPNRRHVAAGVILPGMVSDSLSHLVVVLDTSGSIDDRTLRDFLSEVSAAMDDGAADRVTLVHCDDMVHRADTFERRDVLDPDLPPVGGGGTAFAPAFRWIADNAPDAAAVLYFTDLECWSWGEEPAAPVIWCAWGDPETVRRHAARAPFGEWIHVNPDA
jgi:predicted metal-dependent peptidase